MQTTNINERKDACLSKVSFHLPTFYIKNINNWSNFFLTNQYSPLHLPRVTIRKPCERLWRGRGRRGRGGNGTEEHGSSRCETLLTIAPPTQAICKNPSSAQFCSQHDLGALSSCSNCTCIGLSILIVSDSLACLVSNSFHQIKQQEEEEEKEKAAEGTAKHCLPAWTG